MGGNDHVGEGKKSGCGRVHENIIFMVLEHILGLLLVHIQAHAEELALPDAGDQVIRLYQAASGSVDQDYSSFILLMVSRLIIW